MLSAAGIHGDLGAHPGGDHGLVKVAGPVIGATRRRSVHAKKAELRSTREGERYTAVSPTAPDDTARRRTMREVARSDPGSRP